MGSTKEWNNFFLDAGIPKTVAARYAVTFSDNRMSFEMLMDLNKVSTCLHFVYAIKNQVFDNIPGILERHEHHSSRRHHCNT